MSSAGYQRRCRRNRRRGIDQVRAVKNDIEATCECGAPTAALGLCTTLRPTGQAFANYVVLCQRCVALAEAEGMEIVWLAHAAPEAPACASDAAQRSQARASRPSRRCQGGRKAIRRNQNCSTSATGSSSA